MVDVERLLKDGCQGVPGLTVSERGTWPRVASSVDIAIHSTQDGIASVVQRQERVRIDVVGNLAAQSLVDGFEKSSSRRPT